MNPEPLLHRNVNAYLVTGPPGSGKSTLLARFLEQARLSHRCVGFVTYEIREAGSRTGFKAVTTDGQERLIAAVDLMIDAAYPPTTPTIGRYRVDVDAISDLSAWVTRECDNAEVVIVDEIGAMQCLSARFCAAIAELLDSPILFVGSITQRPHTFADDIKRRSDVRLMDLTLSTPDQIVGELLVTPEGRDD